MNRGLTARERWFVTAVPAILVLAVYGYGVNRPRRANLTDAQRRLSQARQVSIAPSEIAAKQQAAQSRQNQLLAAKRELSGNPAGPQAKTPKDSTVPDEALALAKVTDVFKQRNVLVVDSVRLSDSDARNAMPTGLAEVVKGIFVAGPVKGGNQGGVWRIEMVGSFGDLQSSLAAMDALDVLVVPLCVSMEPSQDGGPLHRWSLWVWM